MAQAVSSEQVRQLREQSGAGMMECKRALEESKGNFDQAKKILKDRGLAKAQKKADRAVGQGLIAAYTHQGRVGVLVELACETDFVAKCDEVMTLARDLTLQVASMAPRYVSREQIPAVDVRHAREHINPEGGAVEKQLDSWYQQICLLEQPFIRDAARTVRDLLVEKISKVGENLVVKRFVRFELGETS